MKSFRKWNGFERRNMTWNTSLLLEIPHFNRREFNSNAADFLYMNSYCNAMKYMSCTTLNSALKDLELFTKELLYISLGYYLPNRKPISAYISDVCACITLGQAILNLYKRKCRLYTWKGVSAWPSSCPDCISWSCFPNVFDAALSESNIKGAVEVYKVLIMLFASAHHWIEYVKTNQILL